MKYNGIKINLAKDHELSPFSIKLLEGFYQRGESSPQKAFAKAATAYCFGDYALAQRIYDYVSNGWFMYASPVLSNAPEVRWPSEFKNWNEASMWLEKNLQYIKLNGLPISCFLAYCEDSVKGLINHESELRFLSISGGGVGSHFSDVRSIGQTTSKGAQTPGILPFLHCIDASMLAYHQGQTRRGNCAVYLDITHPELPEFLDMRMTKGDVNRQNLNLHHAVNITDDFIQRVVSGADHEFIDPYSGNTTGTIPARILWKKIQRLGSVLGNLT